MDKEARKTVTSLLRKIATCFDETEPDERDAGLPCEISDAALSWIRYLVEEMFARVPASMRSVSSLSATVLGSPSSQKTRKPSSSKRRRPVAAVVQKQEALDTTVSDDPDGNLLTEEEEEDEDEREEEECDDACK